MSFLGFPENLDEPGAAVEGSLPDHARHWRREHFIPVRAADLSRWLSRQEDLSGQEREHFRRLCRLLQLALHTEYYRRLQALKDDYALFDPDRVTCEIEAPSAEEYGRRGERLFQHFVELLGRANYRRLSRAEIEEAVAITGEWGLNLHVDFTIFQNLEVFTRGEVVAHRTRRRWARLYRPESFQVDLYQRLVVIFRLHDHVIVEDHKGANNVHLKLFKNIPRADVEMLLPGTQVKMTLLDQGKIWLPTLSGVAISLFKIVKGALIFAFAGLYGLLVFLGLVGGTIGYGVKSFFGYLRTRDRYRLSLTKNLYYQNLDNNAGVLYRLLDEVEEQEFREAILAYYLLWRRADPQGWTAEQIDQQAEALLRQLIEVEVDFEIEDALAKLARLGLAEQGPGGRWAAIPPEIAADRLRPSTLAGPDRRHP